MSNERTDEFLKWRGLLDQPDAEPGQVLDDREATWQKLADRLGERRRNRLSGYRIAAACLLFSLIVPAAHLLRDHHSDAGILPPRQPVRQPPHVSATAVRQSNAPAITAGATAARAVTAAATTASSALPIPRTRSLEEEERAGRGRTSKTRARRTDRNRLPLLADIRLSSIRLSPAPIVAGPPDSASQSLFPRSSQGPLSGMTSGLRTKELKVVHQNEIRGGNTPSPAVGVTSPDRLLNILFRPWRQQPSSVPPSAAEDPALLKIKLSPSN
jgi:hypothetical protein